MRCRTSFKAKRYTRSSTIKHRITKGRKSSSLAPALPVRPFRDAHSTPLTASSTAFDIATDYVNHGIGEYALVLEVTARTDGKTLKDVTMYQRKSTYIISGKGLTALQAALYSEEQPYSLETSDRINLSMPNLFMGGISNRTRERMAALDK